MKHIIIVGDGMADWHNEELGGKTLLQAANTPYMDMLAKNGRTGMLKTIQDGFHPGSEVANSSILGYDQEKVYEGRGPLEAASIGVELAPDDMAIRCNLICIEGENIKNHSCGHLDTEEGKVLIEYLQENLGNERVHFLFRRTVSSPPCNQRRQQEHTMHPAPRCSGTDMASPTCQSRQ